MSNIDIVLATIGLIVGASGAVISALRFRSLVLLGLTIFLACGIYFVGRHGISRRVPERLSGRPVLALASAYFSLLGLSALVWHSTTYDRPASWFLIAAVMAMTIAAQISFIPVKKARLSSFVLLEILLLWVSVRFSIVFSYGSILGVDPWVNWAFFSDSMNAGSLVSGYVYAIFPMFSSLSIQSLLVTGLPYKHSLLGSSGLAVASTVVFAYLIGRKIGRPRLGLYAALLVSMGELSIAFSSHSIIAMSLGIGLFGTLLYILVARHVSGDPRFTYLILLVLMAIIMTHPLVSIIVVFLLLFLAAGSRLLISSWPRLRVSPVTVPLTVLFLAGTVAYWIYVSGTTGLVVDSFRYALTVARGDTVIPSPSDTPVFEAIRVQTSQLAWLGLAIFGSLSILSSGDRRPWMLLLLGVSVAMWSFVSAANLTAHDALLPDRWLPFVGLLLAFVWGRGLVSAHHLHPRLSHVIVPALVGVLAFTVVTAPFATIQHPFYDKGDRTALLESEITAADRLSQYALGSVAVDSNFLLYFQSYLRRDAFPLDERLLNPSVACEQWLVVVRTFVFDHDLVFVKPDSSKLVGYSDERSIEGWKVKLLLEAKSTGKTYDSGTVQAYILLASCQ